MTVWNYQPSLLSHNADEGAQIVTLSQSTIQPTLPDGYSIRPATMDDIPAAVAIWKAVSTAMGQPEEPDEDDMRTEWQRPKFDLASSIRVVEDADRQVVALAGLWDVTEPPVHPSIDIDVHPEHMGKGIEEHLFAWAEATAQRVLTRVPDDARVALGIGTHSGYAPHETLFVAQGYEIRRYWLRMIITMDAPPPQPQLADGFIIRTYNHPDELEAIADAQNEAFRDHYGHIERPPEYRLERWQERIKDDRLFDPSLYFLAIEKATGEIAAMALCRNEEWGVPQYAYIDIVGVRPAYRKRGLGLAMLHHAFGEFYRRGRKTVTLHVDADSLTGATRLYEKAGMHADQKWVSYEKVLRDGREMSRQE